MQDDLLGLASKTLSDSKKLAGRHDTFGAIPSWAKGTLKITGINNFDINPVKLMSYTIFNFYYFLTFIH
jgi:hypothetical protein